MDILCQQFADAHNLFLNELESSEDKQNECHHFAEKENDIFEYRKRVANWIIASEERFNDHLDGLSEIDIRSQRSRTSRKSHALNLSRTSSLARAQERARVAELLAEKAMFQKRVQLEAAEREFELDLKIAKAQARERAFIEIEEENRRKTFENDKTEFLGLPEPKSVFANHKPPLLPSASIDGLRHVKREDAIRPIPSSLDPISQFNYCDFPDKIKLIMKLTEKVLTHKRMTNNS